MTYILLLYFYKDIVVVKYVKNKLSHKKTCVPCWTAYILQDDTRSLQYQVNIIVVVIFSSTNESTIIINI